MITTKLDSQLQLMVTSYIVTALVCLFSLCYLVFKSERSLLRASFVTVQIVTLTWLLFALRERLSPSADMMLLNMRVSLVCVNLTAPLWLITILFYTERISRKNLWLAPAILAPPLVLSAPMLFPASSGMFRLYIRDFRLDGPARVASISWGPFENVTGIVAFCYISLCFCFLLAYFLKNGSMKLWEKAAVLLVIWLPIAAHYSGLFVSMPFDITPLSFTLWGAITIYLSYYRQFFNALPSPVWNIFNVAREGMAVVGVDGSVNLNRSFIEIFGNRGKDIHIFADELCPGLGARMRGKQEVGCVETKMLGSYYEVSIKNLFGRRNRFAGQLMTVSDVSETKQLTLAGERARIASGLHDSMGNRLIASINYMNLALMQPDHEKARRSIDSAITSTVASLMTLRRIVEGLSPVDFNEARLASLIRSVANRMYASGVYTDLRIEGEIETLPDNVKEFVYYTCLEALTNSVIHGKAENISISLERAAGGLRLDVVDDGRGCEAVSKNVGLSTMESRARSLGGDIGFGPPPSGGFGIHARIPIDEGEAA